MYFTQEQKNVLNYWWVFGLIAVVLYAICIHYQVGDIVNFNYCLRYTPTRMGQIEPNWAVTYVGFMGISAIFWLAEGILQRNQDKLKIMSAGLLLSAISVYVLHLLRTQENYTIYFIPSILLHPIALFGAFYALSNRKSKEVVLWSLLGGLVAAYCASRMQYYWINDDRSIINRLIPFTNYFNYAIIFALPSIVFAIIASFSNYGDKDTRQEVHDRVFHQNRAVSKRAYFFLFPALFLILISIASGYNRFFGLLVTILSFDFTETYSFLGILTQIYYTVLFAFIFGLFAVTTANFVIRRLKTLRMTVGWAFLFSFFPFINLIPYFLLANGKEKTEAWDIYFRNEARDKANFRAVFITLIAVYLIGLFIWDFSSMSRYGSSGIGTIVMVHFVRIAVGLLFAIWISKKFEGFWTLLGMIGLGIVASILMDYNVHYSIASYVFVGILFWYMVAKAFHIEKTGIKEEEGMLTKTPIVESL